MNSLAQTGAVNALQNRASDQVVPRTTSLGAPAQASSTADTQSEGSTQVSSLSRLLSQAATRAVARDAGTSREGLLEIVKFTTEKLFGEEYTRNKVAHDAEVPDSDDPVRLAQAARATDFSDGKGLNPFKGMPRDQLALIAYDDSGAFTTNERRAALKEADDQEYQWRVKIVAKMNEEWSRTGKVSAQTNQEILDHYQSLPAIEEAQLPAGYDVQLKMFIQQAQGTESTQHRDALKSLLEAMNQRLDFALVSAENSSLD